MAANLAVKSPQSINPFPLYETIGEFLDDQASEMRLNDGSALPHMKLALLYSLRWPQLMKCKCSLHGWPVQT